MKCLKKITLYLLMFSSSMLLISCEKALLKSDPKEMDRSGMFLHLWQDINDRYSYLDVKQINWDSIRVVLRPVVNSTMDDRQFFDFLASMLDILEDGHANLESPFDRSRYWDWHLDYPTNFDANVVNRNYLGRDYRQAGPLQISLLQGDIVYVYYNSFTREIRDENLTELSALVSNSKGLILDVRNNGGGQLAMARKLAGWLANEDYVYALERIKTGPGRNEFSQWRNLEVRADEYDRGELKVALLTNRRVYSAANFFTQMVSLLPNTAIIGDHTGGGGGTPLYGELANGWIYRFSATQTITPSGEHLEFGIPPDIAVDMGAEDLAEGVDSIIEAALEWLNQ
ncbi:MAG: peptidase S41 [Saprospirales bacterium]|nr:MAG: peptidase S41 [Saprospirales bacterium]